MALRDRLRTHDLWPASWHLRAFLLVGVIETIGDVSIEAVILARFEFFSNVFKTTEPDERTALPVYLGIFVLAHIFQVTLAWEAIYNKNMIQIFGLCVFNAMFLVYAVIQISEVKQAYAILNDHSLSKLSQILVSIIPGNIAVAQLCYLYLSWHIYRLLGWEVFKFLGADRSVKKMYFWYQIFICILKFDFFFFVSFSLQFVLLVLNQSNIERYLTLSAAPCSLILLYIAYLAVRKENRGLMYATFTSCILAAAYFVFKLFRIYQRRENSYRLVYKSLTVFSALSFVLLMCTFTSAIICFRNFGRGLRQHLDRPRTRQPSNKDIPISPLESFDENSKREFGRHYQLPSANSSRMSID